MVAAYVDAKACLPADVGFVHLHDPASAAHGGKLAGPHGLTDAVGEEPRGLVGDPQDPVELVRGAALLGAAKQVDGLQHLAQGDAAMLENGPHLDRELLAAGLLVAFPDANPGGLPLAQLGGGPDRAAMRANRAIRPERSL